MVSVMLVVQVVMAVVAALGGSGTRGVRNGTIATGRVAWVARKDLVARLETMGKLE